MLSGPSSSSDSRAEEREESEIEGNKPLQVQFVSPNERSRKGDEDETYNKVNRYLNKENFVPVPISSSWPIWRCIPLKIKLAIQKSTKGVGDAI